MKIKQDLQEHQLADGLYKFKRENADKCKMCIFELYCTNLNYKPLSTNDYYGLNEREEIVNSTWVVYNMATIKEAAGQGGPNEALQPELTLFIEKDVAYIVRREQMELKKKLLWEMNKFQDVIYIYEQGKKDDILYTCKKGMSGKTHYQFIDHSKEAVKFKMFMMVADRAKQFGY
jgi:hypothetical protein